MKIRHGLHLDEPREAGLTIHRVKETDASCSLLYRETRCRGGNGFPNVGSQHGAYAPSSTSVFGFLYVLPFGAGASVPFHISIY